MSMCVACMAGAIEASRQATGGSVGDVLLGLFVGTLILLLVVYIDDKLREK